MISKLRDFFIDFTYLVRTLDKSSNFCVSNGEDSRATSVLHGAQLKGNLACLIQFTTISSQSRRIILVF